MTAASTQAGAPPPLAAIKALIASEIGPVADELDQAQSIPPQLLDSIGRSGLLGACIATEYGGQAFDDQVVGELGAALGAASCSLLSLFTVHTMVSVAIGRWGTPAQRMQWLPKLAGGAVIGACALSEDGAGSDIAAASTTLTRQGDTLLLHGAKTWISFGQIAGIFLVSAQLDGQLTTVLVDRNQPGLSVTPIRDMYGFRSAMLARIEFDQCVLPSANLLGSTGFGLSRIVGSVLDHGRFCIAWGAAGLAHACLEAAVHHADTRVQFAKPLSEQPLIQQLLSDMMVHSRAAALMCRDATTARQSRANDMLARTTAAKYFAASAAEQVAGQALQIHGALGLSGSHPVQRYARDARILSLIEGSRQIQQMLIAQYSRQWIHTCS